MKTRTILGLTILGLVLFVFAGCVEKQAKEPKETKLAPAAKKEAKPAVKKEAKPVVAKKKAKPAAKKEVKVAVSGKEKMRLRFSPGQVTDYKVVSESTKDYLFTQPSANKTKEQHTIWRTEIVFSQKIESVDRQGAATADIAIKKIKYFTQDPDGKTLDFDSTSESGKKDQLIALVGQSYKIKITPDGKVSVVDSIAARAAVKGDSSAAKIASRLLSDEEIIARHQVLALNDAGKSSKKGDKWSSLAPSPAGMLRPKTFEKAYVVEDIKKEIAGNVATVAMKAEPSSTRVDTTEKDSATNFFANMFDEKDNYNGKLVLNLTTGVIENYKELLKVEWVAVEPLKDKDSDKEPDQLTMGFSNLYSISKVNE